MSGVLHVLLHMAERREPATSEALAKSMNTNSAVIRRILAGLRDKGFVQSEKGHGGGWTLCCDLTKVSLLDIYAALGSPSLFAIGNRSGSPDCLVEQAVNSALDQAFHDAGHLLLARFSEVTLAMLSANVRNRNRSRSGTTRS